MRRMTLGVLTLFAAPLAAQTVTFDGVVQALGGRDRILAVRTLSLEGAGEMLNFGQNHTPFAESRFEVTSYRASVDYANRRWFVDLTRVPRFNTANSAPQRQRTGLDGAPNGVAYNVNAQDRMIRASAQAATDRMHDFVNHPIGFVIAASRPQSEVSVENAASGVARIRLNAGGSKYAMYVDRATMLPTRIERITYHPMLGDVPLWTDLSEWTVVDGIMVPGRIVQRLVDRFTLADYRLTSTRWNGDVGNIAATDSVRALVTQQGGPPAPAIVIDTIAPGVWSVAGQSHHTIAIEQANQVVLVEAPQNDARTLAAIAAARQLRPGKRADVLINTHHHFDHSGGLRAAISEGFTIVTHEGNREFYQRLVLPGRHFIEQDALARNPQPLRVVAVRDKQVLDDPVRPIEIHAIEGNAHSGSMVVVYLPKERMLIQADLYNPPAPNATSPVFPFAANLVENVRRLGLQVDRVVGIHGRPAPFSDVEAARAP